MTRSNGLVALTLFLTGLGGCGKPSQSKSSGDTPSASAAPAGERASGTAGSHRPRVAFVTNGVAEFWAIAEKGALAGGRDFDADVQVRMPPDASPAEQRRMVEDLLTQGVDGIAISPIDPANQQDLLDEIAARTTLITHDSDAPKSQRLCYVGMNNYTAGRMCGQLVKEAMPDGGSVIIFVGRIEQNNARLRRQGLIDELLDRSEDDTRFDPPTGVLEGSKYKILDTRTDNFDMSQAKALPEDAIAKYPDLGCMVGLFEYNPPYIIEALKVAEKQNKIQVVAFDENAATLQAIKDGTCRGTIVQNPYQYGYESVRILAALARGDTSVIPEKKFVNIPARAITQANVDSFWTELKQLVGEKKSATTP